MKKALLICLLLSISKISWCQVVYTFNGNGKWSDSTNWLDHKIPPSILDSNSQINIDPINGGICTLDTLQFMLPKAKIAVMPGKNFTITRKMVIDPVKNGTGAVPSRIDSLLLVPILDTGKLEFRGKLLPSSYELAMPTENDLPPIFSQGSQGSCTAFATAYSARSFYLHKDHCLNYFENGEVNLSSVLSPAFIYNRPNCDGKGISIMSALEKMKTEGVSTWKNMTYDESTCSNLPDAVIKKNASIYKIDTYYRVIDISENNIKRVLTSNNLVIACIKLDYKFWVSGEYIWNYSTSSIIPEGNHAIVICGYDDFKHAYKIMNSWGRDWGFDGFGWIDYNYLKEVVYGVNNLTETIADWELFVMKTSPKFAIDFKFYPAAIVMGSPVTFRDFTEPEPTTREWSFPGGTPSSSTELFPTVTYDIPGTYKVTLKVTPCSDYTKSASKDSQIIVHSLPSLTTTDVSPITSTTAISGGNITDDGGLPITVRGLCWSTSPNPAIDNNPNITSEGIGAGSFASSLAGLTPNTTYYIRAYATNAAGTGYGNQQTFTTFQNSIFPTGNYNTTATNGNTASGSLSLNLIVNNGNITGTVESETGMYVGIGTVTGSTNGSQMSLTVYTSNNFQLCVLYPDGHYRYIITHTYTMNGTTDSNLSFYNATLQLHVITQQGINDPCTPGPVFEADATGTFKW